MNALQMSIICRCRRQRICSRPSVRMRTPKFFPVKSANAKPAKGSRRRNPLPQGGRTSCERLTRRLLKTCGSCCTQHGYSVCRNGVRRYSDRTYTLPCGSCGVLDHIQRAASPLRNDARTVRFAERTRIFRCMERHSGNARKHHGSGKMHRLPFSQHL